MGESSSGVATPRVLYVDPEDDEAGPTVTAIERAGYRVERVRGASAVRQHIDGDVDCVVSRYRLADGDGLGLLKEVRERWQSIPFVLFTDNGTEKLASEAITADVSEYVPSRSGEQRHRSIVDALDRALDESSTDFEAVDETLKDRAMDEAPIGITIADANTPDVPMVYINDSFEDLTGFEREDVLGWNCRFLQGGRSDPDKIDRMREAIDAGEEVSVELVNYTADGEPFWNRVDIAPIYQDGELTHFVGFQTDVTERVEAERAAKREAARATRERETVEALQEQLDGLIADVTGALVESRGRSTVETRVCDRLVAEDRYALACITDPAPGTNATPSMVAGPADALGDDLMTAEGGPVARALSTGDEVFATAPDEGWPMLASPLSDRSIAAIPLQYGESTYGVLVVVAGTASGFDEHERAVLSAVGRATTTALNAIANQRRLNSDEVVELEFELAGQDPFVVGLSADLGCAFEHLGTVTGKDERTTLFFEVTGATVEALQDALVGTEVTCTPLTSSEDRTVVEFEVDETPLVRTLLEQGGRLQSLTASGGTGTLIVDIERGGETRRIVEAVESQLDGASLLAHRQRERPVRTSGDVLDELDDRLTDRQATALRKAYVGGFFEWPRDTTGEELADSMGIDRSTFHQHFRTAQRKVFETLYEA